ncbi:MAG: AAA family ATPase [Candidatus Woesearchaeota archaeon]|nr:MAG: AAA family ATPase [Candidatus Woesearchaeota archaeon]
MTYIVILRGPAGVGKSTIGLRLAKQVAGKHLAIDEVLTSNKLDVIEGDCIPEKNFLRANVISLPFIKETVKENSPLIIDGNFYFAAPLDYFSRFGVPVYVFTLNASLTTCLARDAKRTKPIGARSIKAVYVLSKRISRGRLIDTEHKTVSAICEEILFYVRFEEEKRAKKPSSH